jgi:hypothetical protein
MTEESGLLSVRERSAIEGLAKDLAIKYEGCLRTAKGATPRARGLDAQKGFLGKLNRNSILHTGLRTGVTRVVERSGSDKREGLKEGQLRFDPVLALGGYVFFTELKNSAYDPRDKTNDQFYAQLLGFGHNTAVTTEPGLFCKIYGVERRIFIWTRQGALEALKKDELIPKVERSEHWHVEWKDAPS